MEQPNINHSFQSNAELQGKLSELEALVEELRNTEKTSKLIEVRRSLAWLVSWLKSILAGFSRGFTQVWHPSVPHSSPPYTQGAITSLQLKVFTRLIHKGGRGVRDVVLGHTSFDIEKLPWQLLENIVLSSLLHLYHFTCNYPLRNREIIVLSVTTIRYDMPRVFYSG